MSIWNVALPHLLPLPVASPYLHVEPYLAVIIVGSMCSRYSPREIRGNIRKDALSHEAPASMSTIHFLQNSHAVLQHIFQKVVPLPQQCRTRSCIHRLIMQLNSRNNNKSQAGNTACIGRGSARLHGALRHKLILHMSVPSRCIYGPQCW